ncbi:unnamed protein product [Lymnaea stagnalis]|uniref:Cyclin-like domain-containing protein n=1 Tax=Lymnaea stagnalis TaxID=6523 RepID=A0AAV2HS58_LYMST
MPCWYFERKEIKNSPSFRDGIDTATENRYRREGARFIIDAGTKMGLRYDTCATGVVYFHRFYMFHSFKEFYRYVTAACCLFLAGKVEETPKKCKDIIKIAQSLLSPASFLRFGDDQREEVMTMERILLKTIKFDLQVEHPYSCMLKFAKHFKESLVQRQQPPGRKGESGLFPRDKEKTQKMAQMAWTFINDSLCTTLCLQWEPEIVAVSLMYLASRLTKFEPTDWSSRSSSRAKWWEDFVEGMSMELMEDICHQVLDLYSAKQKKIDGDSPPQSPAKVGKQSPPPPPPPDRTPGKRSREDTPSEAEPAAKSIKTEKDVKPVSSQSSASTTTGAPIPVAQHITPSSDKHPSYSSVQQSNIEFSSYNPYISSQMYTASFMSQEGSQNIQSILAGTAPPPQPVAPSYAEHHSHHPPPPDTSQYAPPSVPQSDLSYGYPPPPSQYQPPSLPPPHSYPPPPSAPPPYDPYAVPQSSYPPPLYPPPPVSQPPPQHSYPPPSIPKPPYPSYYPPSSHIPQAPPPQPPRMSSYSQPQYQQPNQHPSQSQPGPQNYGQQPRHRGNYHKHTKQGNRKDIPALTEIKITGRPEWGHTK